MTYEDIRVGTEIPSLTERVTIVQTAMYCAATWDFARQHYDREFAQSIGFQQPVVDPQMYGAFLTRMLTDWLPLECRLKQLGIKYRLPSFLGDTLTYRGKVVNKRVEGDERYIECELAVTNEKGEHVVEGEAVIFFS
jgi:acyl dehydratase